MPNSQGRRRRPRRSRRRQFGEAPGRSLQPLPPLQQRGNRAFRGLVGGRHGAWPAGPVADGPTGVVAPDPSPGPGAVSLSDDRVPAPDALVGDGRHTVLGERQRVTVVRQRWPLYLSEAIDPSVSAQGPWVRERVEGDGRRSGRPTSVGPIPVKAAGIMKELVGRTLGLWPGSLRARRRAVVPTAACRAPPDRRDRVVVSCRPR